MNLTLKHHNRTDLNLHRQDFLNAVKAEPGTTVICEKGTLWLTQPEDLKDYLLNPGDQLVINRRQNFLIQAISEANLSIVTPN